MDNKFDAYEGFDPTQEKASPNDCGDVYWDMVTQTWRKRTPSKPTNAELNEALAKAKADLNAVISKSDADATKAKADLADVIAKAEAKQAELSKANEALAKQLADQPTECDVLKAHLEPVHRLNGEQVYFAVKDADCDFIKGDVTSLGGETVHPLAEG